jgi:hypothetical protein
MWPHTYLVAIGAIADMPDALTHTRKARMTQLRHEWATQTARTRTTPLPPRCARLTGQKSDVSNSMQLLADEVIE